MSCFLTNKKVSLVTVHVSSNKYKKDTDNNINDEELYKMYLKLKERYE